MSTLITEVIMNVANAEKDHPFFEKYTDIENLRNFPDIITAGELVSITEKLHGTNSRIGYVDGEFMAGTHNMRLKEDENCKYWTIFDEKKRELVKTLSAKYGMPAIMYGEIYGWIQDLRYGHSNGNFSYRCFDIKVGDKYLNKDEFYTATAKFGIDTVPILYKGNFDMAEVLKFSNSKTFAGGDNIMEGVVVTPYTERKDPKIGRVILKYVFDQYLNRKDGTEDH